MRKLVIAVLLSSLSFCSQPGQADTQPEVPHHFRVPVYFVTDRNVLHDDAGVHDFGTERQYRTHCKHDATLGICFCIVGNPRGKELTQHMKDLGWSAESSEEMKPQDRVKITPGDTYQAKQDVFMQKLAKQAGTSDTNDVFALVPGYMSTFASGIAEAATFAYYAERPVLLYSWASAGKFKQYSSDEATIEWSQDHFNTLISRLTKLNQDTDGRFKVRLFAHSMGSRLVLRAVPLLKENPTFDEVSLVCPDADDGVTEHYASRYVSGKGKAHVRLYQSDNDKMLKLSKAVHGGYIRLGQTALPGATNFTDKKPQHKAEATEANVEHTGSRFQTINFSALDCGAVGHMIPVELICSVSQTGHSCEGIKLIEPTDNSGESHKEVNSVLPDATHLVSDYLFAVPTNAPKFKVLSAMKKRVPNFHTTFGKDWTMK